MASGLLFLTLALLPVFGSGESDYRRELADAKKLAQTQRWSQARRVLDRVLVEHEQQPYLIAQLGEVVDLHQRCSFFEDFRTPAPAELVEGELLAWDSRSGKIILRYEDLSGDFDYESGVHAHPIEFVGPYSLELRGRMSAAPDSPDTSAELPQVLVGLEGTHSFQVVFGLPEFKADGRMQWIAPRILRHESNGGEVVSEASSTPLRFGERYQLVVEVSEESIGVRVDGDLLLETEKPIGLFGRIAILNLPGLSQVLLRGIASPTWLNRLADTERARAWQAFRRDWNIAAELPAWVALRIATTGAPAAASGLRIQRTLDADQREVMERLGGLLATARPELGIEELERLAPADLPPELQFFFRALFELALGKPGAARQPIEEAIRIAPDFAEARLIHGRVLGELGFEQQALEVFDDLVARDPQSAIARASQARWNLRFGRTEAARAAVADALRAGIAPEALRETESLLTRALSGPVWQRSFEYRSRFYTVRSDISRQICFDAAQVLDAALNFYRYRLGHLQANPSEGRDSERKNYPVYIFSGRAGYESYAGDLFGSAPESTTGLFSPMLGQLLILNQPDKQELDQILRHEGLHQFLNTALGRLPSWFNEGMAEYFENMEHSRGLATVGSPNASHIALLLSPDHTWISFEDLLDMSPERFYADASPKYAQSWALVHWLLNSGRANAQYFQRFTDELARGIDSCAISELVRSGIDLEKELRLYLTDLAREL